MDELEDLSNAEVVGGRNKNWLIRSKLRAPSQQQSLVERPSLLKHLNKVQTCGLAVVAAPAGFGKTTLLSQWQASLRKDGTSVAWVTLDEDDADPDLFLTYIILALADAGAELGKLEVLANQGFAGTLPHAIIAALFDILAQSHKEYLLILDDYHRLDCPVIDTLIDDILRIRIPNFSLVIATRTKPNIDLPVYVVTGQAIEIEGEALRLTRDETRHVINIDLPDQLLDIWFRKTEGWAVAVQLARFLASNVDPANMTPDGLACLLGGQGGHIASYLTDQIISKLDQKTQNLLINISILERFNFDLANFICGIDNSGEILLSLEALNTLIMPIGEDREWYRYHNLFAECLQGHLQKKLSSNKVLELHKHTSLWFEENHYIGEAVKHACAAHDFARAASLIENAGGWELILFGGIGYLRSLLKNIPDGEAVKFPRLLIAKSYLALKNGQLAKANDLFNLASTQHNADGEGDKDGRLSQYKGLARDILNQKILLQAYTDDFSGPDKLKDFTSANNLIAADDHITRGVIDCNRALHCLAHGRFQEAVFVCRDAMIAMRLADSVLGMNYCYLHAGLAAFYQGDLQLAEANFWEASNLAEDNFGADSGLQALSQTLLSALFFWKGIFSEENHVVKFKNAFAHIETYDGWFEIFATAVEVGFAFDLFEVGDTKTEALTRARRIAKERKLPRLSAMVMSYDLMIATRNNHQQAQELAMQLQQDFPVDCWHENRFLWRPFQVVATALSDFWEDTDRTEAIRYATSRVKCCETVGANLYLIPALLNRAQLVDKTGNRDEALQDVIRAFELAAPNQIYEPFRTRRGLNTLLRAALKYGRVSVINPVVQRFIVLCSRRLTKEIEEVLEQSQISSREYEVLIELDAGLSNKEIARALDLTEHTVKFHLKNIFQKLDVVRRAHAVIEAKKRNIIS